jgi:catechol 2,3-dioxygenase-like lactoylglutathione lyase family enzyme
MEQRISIITLGVRDLATSAAFFERLGRRRAAPSNEAIVFFQCGAIVVSLFPRSELAKDAGVSPDGLGFPGFAIAYNARSTAEVDEVLADAAAQGAELVKPAETAFWGGYSGYFRDLDGHLWEVAWNPGFELDADGNLHLPK